MKKLFNFLKELAIIVGVFFILLILMSGGVSAAPGTYKQNTDINLLQTCDDCTFNNITTIVLGNKTSLIINEAMTQGSGNVFNWTLDSSYTSSFGIYTINGIGDDGGANSIWTYDIEITPSGTLFGLPLSIPVFLPIILMLLIMFICFFLIGFVEKKEYKFTFLILGGFFLIFAIAFGIIASREFLYGFPLLYNFINSFYRIFIISLRIMAIVIPVIIMFFVVKRAFDRRGYNIK